MAWSTRQLAELAGTSLRTVRHYHEVGLLPEPERRSNGYKQYGVAHLVRLLRITRLTDLGFSLAQIAAMGDGDEHPAQALRTLDAELAASIERLQRARVELAALLRESAPPELPPDLATAVTGKEMTAADRSLITVMTRVLGPEGIRTYADVLRSPAACDMTEFDELPAEADERTRAAVAERLCPLVRELYAEHPGLAGLHTDAPGGARTYWSTFGTALKELYNSAQLDVLARVNRMLYPPDEP